MDREQLLASLAVSTSDIDGVYFDGEETTTRYIDWSSVNHRYNEPDQPIVGRTFDFVDEDGDLSQMHLEWEEIERMHHALTILLLQRPSA